MSTQNYFPKAQVRTVMIAKMIFERKQRGETLESIRKDFGYSRLQCSRLYNWYINFRLRKESNDK